MQLDPTYLYALLGATLVYVLQLFGLKLPVPKLPTPAPAPAPQPGPAPAPAPAPLPIPLPDLTGRPVLDALVKWILNQITPRERQLLIAMAKEMEATEPEPPK